MNTIYDTNDIPGYSYICDVSQAWSTVTTSSVCEHVVTAENTWIAKQMSLVHITVTTSIGLYTPMHLTNCVHINIGVHNFMY